MSTAGFPWQAESHVREPTYLDEKAPVPAVPENKHPEPPVARKNTVATVSPQVNGNGKHCSFKDSHPGKQRANSGKAQNLNRSASSHYHPQRHKAGPVQPPVRTLPAWIQDATESDLDDIDPAYLDAPDIAFLAQHNHSPSTPRRAQNGVQEHRSNPTSSGDWRPDKTSRWISFGRASVYPRENFDNEQFSPEYLNKEFGDYSKPWLADREDEDGEDTSRYQAYKKKRRAWYKRIQFTILRNPFIPLAFRLTVMIFALTAIGLGVTIYRETGRISDCLKEPAGSRSDACRRVLNDPQNGQYEEVNYYRDPSALMAIIVDVVSVVYTSYITYDEYFSKPLGLRPARAKVRLVLLDLFFIVFQAANLSLSFESLTVDDGACAVGTADTGTQYRFGRVCSRQEALSAVLLVSLVAWLMTFSVSVLRLVERIM
ncbi:Regulator of phospholipase D SRF1 [Cyphellophora attinorum]|uniref:Regulator of phospholipase D SRF1 n=1 Tax=Cyphellophora attinorum TaxID=1664694 RepID=A0A0N0NQA1_9EURO|nr:Regulator of phospholipase D SRF1 [Phialophora attinorum]KPI43668.1 Regulator of phospholipase D SRF1 [Phialophora attinorum]